MTKDMLIFPLILKCLTQRDNMIIGVRLIYFVYYFEINIPCDS